MAFAAVPSSNAARCQGFPEAAGCGVGVVSARNCSTAAITAAASGGPADESISIRGRGGFLFPFPDTRGTLRHPRRPALCGGRRDTVSSMGWGNRNRLGALVLVIVGFVALPAAASAAKPSFDAPAEFSLRQGFEWDAHDYVASCVGGELKVDIDGRKGWRAKLPGAKPQGGDISFTRAMDDAESLTVTFERNRDGYARRFHVRCLPDDFPDWSFDRIRDGGAKAFMVQMPDFYAAIFSRDGVPVWWMRTDGFADDAKVLPDGTISWNTVQANSAQTGAFDILSLEGNPIRTLGDEQTDVHDLQLLPNGNYLTAQQVITEDVDTTAYGGSSKAAVVNFDLNELTPDGDVVRTWSSVDHIGLDETDRWWPHVLESSFYDTEHWNAVEVDGRYMYLSFRHLDAIYKVDRRTGEIVWKLGGTATPESLQILNDPREDPIGGQHDVRVLPNGTVTIFNNRTDLDDEVPRAERFRIDEEAGTAKLVEAVTDPGMTVARCCGSARRLPDRSWLIAWGSNATIGAYDEQGRPIYRMTIPDDAFTYRANPVEYATIAELREAMDRMNR